MNVNRFQYFNSRRNLFYQNFDNYNHIRIPLCFLWKKIFSFKEKKLIKNNIEKKNHEKIVEISLYLFLSKPCKLHRYVQNLFQWKYGGVCFVTLDN